MKVLFALFALFSLACGAAVQIGTCYLRGTTNDPTVRGTVTFTLVNSTAVTVTAHITGIAANPDADHGLHIHQWGDVNSADGSSAGSHWDPFATAHHSCFPDANRHQGDMGNWTAASGTIDMSKTLDLITLTGDGSIIGRAVVLHNVPDDCTTQPAGGVTPPRGAYCVIGLADPGTGNNNAALAPQATAAVTAAICVLKPTEAISPNNIAGTIFLTQATPTSPTRIFGSITGLVDGSIHGFHIHEFGDVSNANGTAAGAHYNPLTVNHGIPPFAVRHIGDMGNIFYYLSATAYYDYTNDQISLTGEYAVLGHTIIIHSVNDSCAQPYGNAGSRLAQCVIGVKNPATTPLTVPNEVPVTQDAALCNIATDTNTSTEQPSLAATQVVSIGLLAIAMILALF